MMYAFVSRRGIPAQPILNGYCGSYEQGMSRSMIDDPMFNYEKPIWMDMKIPLEKAISTVAPLFNTATSVAIHSFIKISILIFTCFLFSISINLQI